MKVVGFSMMWNIVIGALLVVVLCAVGWYVSYSRGLRPRLVLRLPIEECQGLDFNQYTSVASGREVMEICRKHEIPNGPIFAVRGRKAVKFVPAEYDIQFEPADKGTVYFYLYNWRYQASIVEAP